MSKKIYLIQDDGTLATLEEQAYQNEDLLQTLLEKYPELLAGDQINETNPRRWLMVSREISFPDADDGGDRMALDHLFLDQDGIPTLVEVKRSSDTRIRREVVGQMLDYATNAIGFWSMEFLRAQYETSIGQTDRDPDEYLSQFLGLEEMDENRVDSFWQQVKTNLQAQKIRLLFVADEIPPSLRRIVEFLNQQMDPAEVLAVELPQYVGTGIKTIVPRLIGQTNEKGKPQRETKEWNEDSFFAELAQRREPTVKVAHEIMIWSKRHATEIHWGKGMVTGAFVPTYVHNKKNFQLFAVLTTGMLELYLAWHRQKRPFDRVDLQKELITKLNCIEGISLPSDAIQRQPKIVLADFRDTARLAELLAVYEWMIEQVQQNDSRQS